MKDNYDGHCEKTSLNFDEISKIIDELPVDKKQQLAQKLLGLQSGLIVILGSNNIINNSLALLNESSAEEISKKLKDISPEAVEKLIDAIAMKISNNKTSNYWTQPQTASIVSFPSLRAASGLAKISPGSTIIPSGSMIANW